MPEAVFYFFHKAILIAEGVFQYHNFKIMKGGPYEKSNRVIIIRFDGYLYCLCSKGYHHRAARRCHV